MKNEIISLTPELVSELNFLARYDLDTQQEGFKIHHEANPVLKQAVQRLFDKSLITQADGGYLTALGREVAEHIQSALTILNTN